MQPVRVLIVDDTTLMRDGLRALMEAGEGLTVAGEAQNGQQAVALAARLQPDVVLMDIGLPDMDGIAATRQVRAVVPNAAVVIVTMYDDDEYLFSALKAGAVGYVLKDSLSEELATAIKCAVRGQSWLHPAMASKLVASVASDRKPYRPPRGAGPQLTHRERQVLDLLSRSYSNVEIGQALELSEKTVKQHVTKLFKKLGVRSRSQAVIYAMQHGLHPDR